MSHKANDIVTEHIYDALADMCEKGKITLDQHKDIYKAVMDRINGMPSAEEIGDDHIQQEVEEHINDQINE